MYIDNKVLCDFCFNPTFNSVCTKCGLTHETYKSLPGLLKPGTVLNGKTGDYIIGRHLGRGGFGATYMAYSTAMKAVVAIKEYFPMNISCRSEYGNSICVLSEENKEAFLKGANRLYDEACRLAEFNNSENIVSVYEYFNANDTVYYAMEYLDGYDLKNYIKRCGGRLSVAETVSIMRSVCKALTAVHSANLLHRDISPDNIFVCNDGRIKLIDFGNARQFVSNATQNFSKVVKYGFSPPEQFTNNVPQGAWTDTYSVGATMYYTLTGNDLPNVFDYLDKPFELEFDKSTDKITRAVITKCLQYKTEDRYQNAFELLEALHMIDTGSASYVENDIYIKQNDVVPPPPADDELTVQIPPAGVVVKDRDSVINNRLMYALIATLSVLFCLLMVMVFANFAGFTPVNPAPPPPPVPIEGDVVAPLPDDLFVSSVDENIIESIIDDNTDYTDFGIYVYNKSTKYQYSYSDDMLFAASGLSQVVVLDTLAQIADSENVDIDDTTMYFEYLQNGKESPDSADENGTYIPIRKYIEDVAVYGDNNKSNSLIDYIGYLKNSDNGFDVINNALRSNGNKNTNINRKTYTGPSAGLIDESVPQNMTTAKEIAGIFDNLINSGILGNKSYMMNIFRSVSAEGKPIGLKCFVPDTYDCANVNARNDQITSNVALIRKGSTEIVVAILSYTDESHIKEENMQLREDIQGRLVEYIIETQFKK